jgi:hypothetical protein
MVKLEIDGRGEKRTEQNRQNERKKARHNHSTEHKWKIRKKEEENHAEIESMLYIYTERESLIFNENEQSN